MRTKSWVLLVVALGCGLVASVAISQVVRDQRKQTPDVPTVEVLVAAKDIDAAGKLSKDNVKLEKWPRDRVPQGAITDFKEAEGKFANQSVFQGEPIVVKKLINAVDSISGSLAPGFRIFDLAVNDKDGGVGYIKAGDRVDVFGFFEKGGKVPETKTIPIVENVVVKAVDGNAVRDNGEQGPKTTKTIQLMIRESQFEVLNTASNLGKLKVALRGVASNEGDGSEEFDNGENFIAWLKTAEKLDEPKQTETKKELFQPVLAVARNEDKSPEMVVISPAGVQRYRFGKKNELPELVTPEKKDSLNGTTSFAGVNGSNMVWDPAAGKWTTSGLSPAYPAPKKSGSSDDSSEEGADEAPDSQK